MGNVFALTTIKTHVFSSSGESFFSSEVVFNSVVLNSSSLPGPLQYNWQCQTQCLVVSLVNKIDTLQLVMDFSETQIQNNIIFLTSPIRAVGTVVVNTQVYSASSLVTCSIQEKNIVFLIRIPCPKKTVDVSLNCILATS
jgi:hypothetical protein